MKIFIVRSGEVVKTSTVLDEKIINETKKVIDYLNYLKDENNLSIIGPFNYTIFKNRR